MNEIDLVSDYYSTFYSLHRHVMCFAMNWMEKKNDIPDRIGICVDGRPISAHFVPEKLYFIIHGMARFLGVCE